MDRTEYKFILSPTQAAVVRARIAPLMQRDPHALDDGKYLVRSRYFDTPSDRCLFESENGITPRKKYRIRSYNNDVSMVRLEIKERERTKVRKKTCLLGSDEAPMKEFDMLVQSEGLREVCTVEYRREAFVYGPGNVRICFDTCIIAEKEGLRIPVLMPGEVLLEVKFDTFLPDHLREALNIGSLRAQSFSKYVLSRRALI